MRKLRVVFVTASGAVPALVATMLVSTAEGCGSGGPDILANDDAAASPDAGAPGFDAVSPPPPEPPVLCSGESGGWPSTHIVELPPPGVPAAPGQLCAVPEPVATSNTAARVTLVNYSPSDQTTYGFIAVPPSLAGTIVDPPTISVVSASPQELATMSTRDISEIEGGFQFRASWPNKPRFGEMTIKTSFSVACEEDGGTKLVESLTKLELCADEGGSEWVSSGDACTICSVIAEMAPSPIVSDNRGDDLPLGSVLRLRVVEVARAGRQVLLFAETDAGESAEYEWRVSEGSLERVADDVMLWTLPETERVERALFGQVAVWNEAGAAVENFLSGVTWEAA